MDENFKRLKKKYLVYAILKSAAIGLSCGLVAVGVALLSVKLSSASFGILWYVLIGVGALLVGGVLSFVFLKPDDKYAARRLDGDYNLEERVQTSLEYAGASGAVVEMQRKDTESKLADLTMSKPAFSKIWQYFVVVIIAVAVALAGIFVPGDPVGAKPVYDDNTPREVTQFELVQLNELIENVRSSKLEDDIREDAVGELEGLVTDLADVHTEGALKRAVYGTIDDIDALFAAIDSYRKITASLSGDGQNVCDFISDGAQAGETFGLLDYNSVVTFYGVRHDSVTAAMERGLSKFRLQTAVSREDGLATVLRSVVNSIRSALTASGLTQSDGLYAALDGFAIDLSFMQTDAAGNSVAEDVLLSNISTLIDEFAENIVIELTPQSYHYAMDTFISRRLQTIFGYEFELPDLPTDEGGSGEQGGNDDEEQGGDDRNPNSPGGSIDSGEVQYGSNDEVYDPIEGRYVKYGELFAKYNELNNLDSLTEEQRKIVNTYYDILTGGFGGGQN